MCHFKRNNNILQFFILPTERQRNSNENIQFNYKRVRFRKRDKMQNASPLRKVKILSGQAYNEPGHERRSIVRFAKRILNIERDDNSPMILKTVEPSNVYLEEMTDGSDKVPTDTFCTLQGIRIFGHFEKPIVLKLCKYTETINLDTNDLLFKIGRSIWFHGIFLKNDKLIN